MQRECTPHEARSSVMDTATSVFCVGDNLKGHLPALSTLAGRIAVSFWVTEGQESSAMRPCSGREDERRRIGGSLTARTQIVVDHGQYVLQDCDMPWVLPQLESWIAQSFLLVVRSQMRLFCWLRT
jgi:hypothetical protein